mgnify:CR=1 FL=1
MGFLQEWIVALFAWMFRIILGKTLKKETPRNKWTLFGSRAFGVFILGLFLSLENYLNYYDSTKAWFYLIMCVSSFLVSFFFMLKGFSENIPEKDKY